MKEINTIVIAVGGEGKRLSEYFNSINFHNTKTLFPVAGQPFLKYLIDLALMAGYRKVFLLASYYEDNIKEFVNCFYKDKNVKVVCGGEPGRKGGVAKVLSNIENQLSSPFIYTDGDIFFEYNLLATLSDVKFNDETIIKCVISPNDRALTHSKFIIKDGGLEYIRLRLDSKDNLLEGYCSMGVMVVNNRLFESLPSYKDMNDLDIVVNKLFNNRKDSVNCIIYEGDWLSIHGKEDIDRINNQHYSWLSSLKISSNDNQADNQWSNKI